MPRSIDPTREPFAQMGITLGLSYQRKLKEWAYSKRLSLREAIEEMMDHYFETKAIFKDEAERLKYTSAPEGFPNNRKTFIELVQEAQTVADLPPKPDIFRDREGVAKWNKRYFELAHTIQHTPRPVDPAYRARLDAEQALREKRMAAEKAAKEAQTASDVPAGEDWL